MNTKEFGMFVKTAMEKDALSSTTIWGAVNNRVGSIIKSRVSSGQRVSGLKKLHGKMQDIKFPHFEIGVGTDASPFRKEFRSGFSRIQKSFPNPNRK